MGVATGRGFVLLDVTVGTVGTGTDTDTEAARLTAEALRLAFKKAQNEAIESVVDLISELGKKTAALASLFVEINIKLNGLIREEVVELQKLQGELNLVELQNEAQIRDEIAQAAQILGDIIAALAALRPESVAMGLVRRDP